MSTDETENTQQLCGTCTTNEETTDESTNSVRELNKLLESALRMSKDDTHLRNVYAEFERGRYKLNGSLKKCLSESLNNDYDKNDIRESQVDDNTASWRVDTARRLCSVSIYNRMPKIFTCIAKFFVRNIVLNMRLFRLCVPLSS